MNKLMPETLDSQKKQYLTENSYSVETFKEFFSLSSKKKQKAQKNIKNFSITYKNLFSSLSQIIILLLYKRVELFSLKKIKKLIFSGRLGNKSTSSINGGLY